MVFSRLGLSSDMMGVKPSSPSSGRRWIEQDNLPELEVFFLDELQNLTFSCEQNKSVDIKSTAT